MKTISPKTIDETWERISQASESESRALARKMQDEEPLIMVYLLAMDEELYDETERGRLMELGAIVWQIMRAGGQKLPRVTEAELQQAEEANLKWLEDLHEGREVDFLEATQNLMRDYNQTPLLGALLQALMQGHEDAPDLAPENIGMALVYLKTIIDCLDKE